MNIIERNKSFTIESFKERSAALANFLAENPPLTYCIIIRMDSSNKITYRAMFLDKKYWIAHYFIELTRFQTGTILNDISREFLCEFCNTSIKLTPYKKARYKALSQLKYSNLPRIIIYWILGCHLKYALMQLKAPKEVVKNSFVLTELIMDLNLQSMQKSGFKRRNKKSFDFFSFLKRIVIRRKIGGGKNDRCNVVNHSGQWHRDLPCRKNI